MKVHLCTILLCIVGLSTQFKVLGQQQEECIPALIKFGAWLNHSRLSSQNSYLLNLEFEKAFARAPFFSMGPRADLKFFSSTSAFETFSMGYQLKGYPLFGVKKIPYNGLYLGTDLSYFFKIQSFNLTGPGVSGMIGYQSLFRDKFLIGCEFRQTYMKNFNAEGPFLTHSYFVSSLYLKVGIKLNAKKPL